MFSKTLKETAVVSGSLIRFIFFYVDQAYDRRRDHHTDSCCWRFHIRKSCNRCGRCCGFV